MKPNKRTASYELDYEDSLALGMNRVSEWPMNDAPSLLNRALSRRAIVQNFDLSDIPAGAQRQAVVDRLRYHEKLLTDIINQTMQEEPLFKAMKAAP